MSTVIVEMRQGAISRLRTLSSHGRNGVIVGVSFAILVVVARYLEVTIICNYRGSPPPYDGIVPNCLYFGGPAAAIGLCANGPLSRLPFAMFIAAMPVKLVVTLYQWPWSIYNNGFGVWGLFLAGDMLLWCLNFLAACLACLLVARLLDRSTS